MAQQTSDLWKELYETAGTYVEYKFDVNGVEYGADALISQQVSFSAYAEYSFGNASTATLKLSLYADDIPRGATVKRFARLVNGSRTSEWLSKGVFFVSRRAFEDGVWDIEAFDAMRKAEAMWTPSPKLQFPLSMKKAADDIAGIMGCAIDPRTTINEKYTLDYPADYTMRQVLQYIAAVHGGNWIVTEEGKLLLLPLDSAPEETYYLVTEYGRAITLGGVRILVK